VIVQIKGHVVVVQIKVHSPFRLNCDFGIQSGAGCQRSRAYG
jgi:hypothetical protein